MNQAARVQLELAATAAGYLFNPTVKGAYGLHVASVYDQGKQHLWNSLNDDGDAARLAADMGFRIVYDEHTVHVFGRYDSIEYSRVELYGRDRYRAARLAITLLAYDIGCRMS